MNAPPHREGFAERFLKKTVITIAVFAFLYVGNLWYTGNLQNLALLMHNPRVQLFTMVVVSILLEAIPFTFIGSLFSGILAVLVPDRVIQRAFSKRRSLSILAGASIGLIFPVCSCGIVPVARRLLKKGLPSPGVVTYLIAAPIINPVTIISTAVAFSATRGPLMSLWRILFAFAIAVPAGYILGFHGQEAILREDADEHDHTPGSRLERILRHATDDFLLVGKYVILGTFIAGIFQAWVPKQVVLGLASHEILSVIFMQAMAMALSMCSFADAFIASSFVSLPAASQIVFMTAGPTVSIALMTLYLGTFRRKFALRTISIVSFLILALGTITALIVRTPGGAS